MIGNTQQRKNERTFVLVNLCCYNRVQTGCKQLFIMFLTMMKNQKVQGQGAGGLVSAESWLPGS